MLIVHLLSVLTKKTNLCIKNGYLISLPETTFRSIKDPNVLVKVNSSWKKCERLGETNKFFLEYDKNIIKKNSKIKIDIKSDKETYKKVTSLLREFRLDSFLFCLQTDKEIKEKALNLLGSFIRSEPLKKCDTKEVYTDTNDIFIKDNLFKILKIIKRGNPINFKKISKELYKLIKKEHVKYLKSQSTKYKSTDKLVVRLGVYNKIEKLISTIVSIWKIPLDPNIEFEYFECDIIRCFIVELKDSNQIVNRIITDKDVIGLEFIQFGNKIYIKYANILAYTELCMSIFSQNQKLEICLVKRRIK